MGNFGLIWADTGWPKFFGFFQFTLHTSRRAFFLTQTNAPVAIVGECNEQPQWWCNERKLRICVLTCFVPLAVDQRCLITTMAPTRPKTPSMEMLIVLRSTVERPRTTSKVCPLSPGWRDPVWLCQSTVEEVWLFWGSFGGHWQRKGDVLAAVLLGEWITRAPTAFHVGLRHRALPFLAGGLLQPVLSWLHSVLVFTNTPCTKSFCYFWKQKMAKPPKSIAGQAKGRWKGVTQQPHVSNWEQPAHVLCTPPNKCPPTRIVLIGMNAFSTIFGDLGAILGHLEVVLANFGRFDRSFNEFGLFASIWAFLLYSCNASYSNTCTPRNLVPNSVHLCMYRGGG